MGNHHPLQLLAVLPPVLLEPLARLVEQVVFPQLEQQVLAQV